MVIKMILIGAEVKCGSFTDRQTGKEIEYNNLMLYFEGTEELENPESDNFSFGREVHAYKIKNEADTLKSAFKGFYKEDNTGEWLKNLAGVDFEIIENRYGGIQRVLLN